ncbi:Protein of unknown function [Jatrophihabitans endophyticus]|uniref:DUF4012 domain-containing protein n=1 Tax=Jatrophihabitans endophyticus TaxID=1206085 RepID=A0A1M5U8F4_9ACTN|nr:DUF4012 domain-containing protein [Jatrophihabitans endophyticus]SHH59254.1 Protein of unknown function [Jatrophihabitans endophyticus]
MAESDVADSGDHSAAEDRNAAGPSDDHGASDSSTGGRRAGRARLAVTAGWVLLGLLVLGGVWIVVTGILARSQLNAARAQLSQLRTAVAAGRADEASRLVDAIRDHTGRAAALTSGPAWWVGRNMPGVGSPLQTVSVVVTQANHLADDALPGAVELARTLPAGNGASSIDLPAIEHALPVLARASASTSRATDAVAGADPSWLPFVSNTRSDLLRQLQRLDGELSGADRAARIALPMLGRDRPQRYFVGFMNEAESRGGGGIAGGYAIAVADHGRLRFEHFGTDSDFAHVRSNARLSPELLARYGNTDPTGVIQNSNLTPDFSVTGRIWAGFWEKRTGETVDGALAVDPTALSYLLRVTGGARLADGTRVTTANVVGLTQRDQYRRFPGLTPAANRERKAYLTSVARALSNRLVSGGDRARLARALSRSARERRLVVWSANERTESLLRTAQWAGSFGNEPGAPYSAFVVNNAAGSKLDYYLDRTASYTRRSCAAGGAATATLTLRNSAPRHGLPPYVTYRADKPAFRTHPGDNQLLVTYYGSAGASLRSMTVDGRTVGGAVQTENGLLAVTIALELPVSTSRTVTVTLSEPASHGPVRTLVQPSVRPPRMTVGGARCGS